MAYGVFQDKQAAVALSYLTSPVFHWLTEKDESYQAAIFANGHPLQIEYAAVPDSCRECDLAVQFTRFLLEPETQKLIMEKNFMLPVVADAAKGTPFEKLPTIPIRRLEKMPELQRDQDALLKRWRELEL
jgi:thiamine transport system substrate-binding protein